MNRKNTPSHQHTQTPAHPDSRKPTRTLGLVCSNFNLRNKSLKLKLLTRCRTRNGLRKTNSALKKKQTNRQIKCYTSDKELHNLIRCTFGINFGIASRMFHNRQRIAQPQSWQISRHQGTPKSMHASGTSGLVASRDDGAIFLTASKTYQESLRRAVLLTLEGSSSERRTCSYSNTDSEG